MLWWESLRRLCGRDLCPCCVGAGARAYLRLLDNRCSVTQQLLSDVEAFSAFECVKCVLRRPVDLRAAPVRANTCRSQPCMQVCETTPRAYTLLYIRVSPVHTLSLRWLTGQHEPCQKLTREVLSVSPKSQYGISTSHYGIYQKSVNGHLIE